MTTQIPYRICTKKFTAPGRHGLHRKVEERLSVQCLGFLIIGVCAVLILTSTGCSRALNMSKNKPPAIEQAWGVQIVGVRRTAAGHMLDFRFRVVDAKKAAPLFFRQTKPYLIDQASGKSLVVPNMAKVGPLRSSNRPQEGRTYWMFFGNPGLVKAGSKVSVVIGDFRADNLIVQ